MASDSAPARKVYSRNELFQLAEALNDDEIDRELLNKFKETKLVYNLDVINAERAEELESRPKLIRTLSNQQSLDRNYRGPLQRLSRMTSSPSLRYNKNHLYDSQQNMVGKSDTISMQVKAKYAELIDNLSTTGNSTRRPPVTRSASLNTWQAERAGAAERPSTLFGPLRREVNRNQHNRRDSDEPLSLPYFHHQTNADAKRQISSRFMDPDTDDFLHSPIKRIGSFGNSADNKANAEGEDDDFDLNSMINITVLSDIKTIRQDFQQQQQQSSFSSSQGNLSSNRLQRQGQLKGRELRGQDQRFSNSQRPLLTRSRTATEFNYRGRFAPQQASQMPTSRIAANRAPLTPNDRSFAPASSLVDSSASAFESSGYESMPCTYGWQLDEQIRQNAQRGTSPAAQSKQSTQEPKDEEAKKIIEAFKAQVLARAASSVGETSSASENAKSETEKKQSTGEKRETSKSQIEVPTDRQDANTPKSTTTPISSREKDQVQAEAPKNDDSKIESSKSNSTKTPAAGSNIPRLISLHSKATLKTTTTTSTDTTIKTTTTEQTTKTPTATAARKTTPITRSSSVSSKFVSQYRQLRGKSLADELGDHSK